MVKTLCAECLDIYGSGADLVNVCFGYWNIQQSFADGPIVSDPDGNYLDMEFGGTTARYRASRVAPTNTDRYKFAHMQCQRPTTSSSELDGNQGIGFNLSGGGRIQITLTKDLGNVQVGVNGAVADTDTSGVPVGAWTNLTIGVDTNTGDWAAWRDQTIVLSGNAANLTGDVTSIAIDNRIFDYDDLTSDIYLRHLHWYERDDSFTALPAHRTSLINIDASRANQDFSVVGAANAVAALGNRPGNISEYIESATNGDISDFDGDGDGASIFAVYGVVHRYLAGRDEVTTVDMNGRLIVSGNIYDGATVNPPDASQQYFEDIYNENPDTTSDWVPGDLVNIGMGYERTS